MSKKISLDTSTQVLVEFGDDFGNLLQQDIAKLFVKIEAGLSPLEPLLEKMADEPPTMGTI